MLVRMIGVAMAPL